MGTGLISPCSVSSIGVIFSNSASLSVFGEQSIPLAAPWVVWGFPMGLLWPPTQLDVTDFWYWKLYLVMRDFQLECHVSIIRLFLLDSLPAYINFKELVLH